VVEEAWTDGNVVVDETVTALEGEGVATAVIDEVVMTEGDTIEEVVVVEQVDDDATVEEEA